MFFYRRTVPGLAIQSYLIGHEGSKKCVVVDPVRDVDEYLRVAEENGFRITDILETHVHADFVSGSLELKARLDGAPVIHCSVMGGEEWTPSYVDQKVRHGDEVLLGSVRLRALHTPGHTPEHLAWEVYEQENPLGLLTGDLLFVGAVGRPDLLGKEAQQQLAHQLYHTLFNRIALLPDTMEIYPAHGAGSLCGKAISAAPSSSLGRERRENESLKMVEEQVWTKELMEDMPMAPAYFPRMKQVNVKGPAVIGDKLPGHRAFSSKETEEFQKKGAVLLDIRSKEAFSAAHIPGSINIPVGAGFSNWAGWILPYDKPLILLGSDGRQREEAVISLLRVGLDDIAGFVEGGIAGWEQEGRPLAHIQTESVDEFYERWQKEAPFVLDVRTDDEWRKGHIEGAHHIHLGLLSDCLDSVPMDQPVAIICGSGYRASLAASLLQNEGHKELSNVFGGMTAWRERGYPTVSG